VKKLLLTFLKVGLSVAIVGYLIYDATHGKGHANVFANLRDEPKQWDWLFIAFAANTFATLLTFIRWWFLIRAQGIPCRFRDALRISFWGYLFNLAPLGIVGGDLVKAVMLDHEHHGYRAPAIASVFVDRVIGLYWLFIVASTAILLTGFWQLPVPDLWRISLAMWLVTLGSTVGLAIVLGPEFLVGGAIRIMARIPRVGRPLESLLLAVRMYRGKPKVLVISSLLTIGVHLSFASGCYCIACGLPGNHLSLPQHFVVMPLSAAMQVIPIPIGPTEAALKYLYEHVPVAGPAIIEGQGLVVSLAYRLITLLIAALGIFYYFGNRREMAEVMHEAEAEQEAEQKA
jgi:uncharacterized protein (TIRG00374 family)